MAPSRTSLEIVDRRLTARIAFGDAGVTITNPFVGRLHLSWPELEYVCVTPTMERGPDGWRERRFGGSARLRSTFATSGTLHLWFVVRDRRPVIARSEGAWRRTWVRGLLVRMCGADERVNGDQALLKIEVRASRLDHPVDDLLDLLAERCRFDLVVSF